MCTTIDSRVHGTTQLIVMTLLKVIWLIVFNTYELVSICKQLMASRDSGGIDVSMLLLVVAVINGPFYTSGIDYTCQVRTRLLVGNSEAEDCI